MLLLRRITYTSAPSHGAVVGSESREGVSEKIEGRDSNAQPRPRLDGETEGQMDLTVKHVVAEQYRR